MSMFICIPINVKCVLVSAYLFFYKYLFLLVVAFSIFIFRNKQWSLILLKRLMPISLLSCYCQRALKHSLSLPHYMEEQSNLHIYLLTYAVSLVF